MSEYSPYDLLKRRHEPLDKKFNPSGIGPGMSYGKLLSILIDSMPGSGIIGDAKSGVDAIDAALQGDFLGAGLAGLGVLPFVGSLKSLPIGHPDLSKHPLDELQSVLDEMRSVNKGKNLDIETGTGAIRDEIARRNAVDMLGMPETNTAMDRAKALGYTQDAYHGTPYGGSIYNFGSEHRGRSTNAKSAEIADWASDSPVVATSYADQPTTSTAGPYKNWLHFAENYTNPKIDELRKEVLELNTQLETIDSEDFINGVDDILNRKNQIGNEINDEMQREWKKINPQRQTVYPLRVKDATTFDPKQEGALGQLNKLVDENKVERQAAVDKLSGMDSYKAFAENAKMRWGDDYFDNKHPLDALYEMMPDYKRAFANNNEFMMNMFRDVGAESVYKDIEKNPDLLRAMIPVNPSKYTRQIPTVYDAKGNSYETIPQGLSGQLRKAPEGTEVFRFNNLVDPDPAATHYAIMKPNAVRSKFAAFDPARKDESNLLASIAAGGISIPLLLRMLEEDQYGY